MGKGIEDVKEDILAGNTIKFYSLQIWKRKRKQILIRDHYQCQRCLGRWNPKPDKSIRLREARYVHHIESLISRTDLALTDSNLISLCFACHEEIEGRQDRFQGGRGKKENKNKNFIERW